MRWWDGERWTQQVRFSQPPPGGPPPDAARAVEDDQPGSKRSRPLKGRSRALLIGAAVVVGLGGITLVARSMSSNDSHAAYEDCRHEVQPVLAAMQSLGSHLDVGVIQQDYANEVGDVKAAYDRLNAQHPATPCQPVVRALGEAMDAYTEASSEWNECIFYEEEECGEASVQELWSSADDAITRSKQRLNSLSGGAGAVAAAESDQVQAEADALAKEQIQAAQIALETYATEHKGSYEGATPPTLREIEPTLPSSLEVTEAGPGYFSISVGSQGGNWFEIDREVGGELVFPCGESGKGGCSASGEWK